MYSLGGLGGKAAVEGRFNSDGAVTLTLEAPKMEVVEFEASMAILRD